MGSRPIVEETARGPGTTVTLCRSLSTDLSGLIKSGRCHLRFRMTLLVIELPASALFPRGQVALTDEGEETLSAVGRALAPLTGWSVLVAGRMAQPGEEAPSEDMGSWLLARLRARAAMAVLIAAGVSASRLLSAGFQGQDPALDVDDDPTHPRGEHLELFLYPDFPTPPPTPVTSG